MKPIFSLSITPLSAIWQLSKAVKCVTVSGSALVGLLSCWTWLPWDSCSLSDSASLCAASARWKEKEKY